jgi:hypothetical protein
MRIGVVNHPGDIHLFLLFLGVRHDCAPFKLIVDFLIVSE